jgi:hypothetical protein
VLTLNKSVNHTKVSLLTNIDTTRFALRRKRIDSKLTMGSVIGKENVAEPTFKVLLQRVSAVHATYEIREYGARFVGTSLDAQRRII